MRKILFLAAMFLSLAAYSQAPQPTNSKTRFNNGVYFGCGDSARYTNGADTIVLYFRCPDSSFYVKYKGYHRKIAFSDEIVNLDTGRVNGQVWTAFLANKTRDSLASVKLNISDTAAMLAGKVKLQIGSITNQYGNIGVTGSVIGGNLSTTGSVTAYQVLVTDTVYTGQVYKAGAGLRNELNSLTGLNFDGSVNTNTSSDTAMGAIFRGTQVGQRTGGMYGGMMQAAATHTSGTVGVLTGARGWAISTGTGGGAVTNLRGVEGRADIYNNTVTNRARFYAFKGLGSATNEYSFQAETGAGVALFPDGVNTPTINNAGAITVQTTSNSATLSVRSIDNAVNQANLRVARADNAVSMSTLNHDAQGWNTGADAVMFVGSVSGRSINAGGTVNASGADYAEYMRKAAYVGAVDTGDIIGVDHNGLLTSRYDSAHSFVIKSTDPSYVGGDGWGSEKQLGKKPEKDSTITEQAYQTALTAWKLKRDAAKNSVEIVAFSGQVPVNVQGAKVGDYIIPIRKTTGGITGVPVSSPSFDQYKIAVGRVWKVLPDGRAWVAVKIG